MNIETAGSRLKKIRQERGLSLEDIQKKTRIHLNVLRAIEGDSISNLSPIYLKGFIKIYCGCLGLDAKDFIGQNSLTQQPQKPALNATVGRPIGARVEKRNSFIKDASIKLGAIRPLVDLKKVAIAAVIAVVAVFLITSLFKFISSRPKTRLEKVKIAMPVSVPKVSIVPAPAAQQTKINKDLAQGFTLGISARSKSWISAKVDGKVVFHGVLARGRSETWQAREKAELSLGDAAAVELQVNDQRFANLGRRGQSLKNIVINKDGLKISR
ncbi:MAG: helix-turn-helix domain-containing protein [Candidatus Omnitrophica bacterium]|nr:helix-turn-helix domain-containing protein [Candidatus Omnitrophota bacterium]